MKKLLFFCSLLATLDLQIALATSDSTNQDPFTFVTSTPTGVVPNFVTYR